jgi:hypothetical protein
MPLLPLTKPETPVFSPGDTIPVRPLHAPRAAVIAVDVRTTGLLYHTDASPNTLSLPYSIAMVASILDDNNKPIPYDALSFRVAVPGYLTLDTDLQVLMKRLEGVAYHQADTGQREKARVAAQAAFGDEGVPVPFIMQRSDAYEALNPEHGLNHEDAASLMRAFVSRFEGGAIVAGQNLRLTLEMIDRIGFKLDVEANVYHRMVEMYSIFAASALQSGVFGIPSLLEMVAVPAGEQKDALASAQYITAFLVNMIGPGTIPGQVFAPAPTVEETTDQVALTVFAQVGNLGLEDITVTPTLVGAAFTCAAGDITIAGGEVTVFPVAFATEEEGTHTAVLTFDDGTQTVDVNLEVSLASS